ncbi:MAG: FAD-dependent oxidoreductase [Elusimicrobiota bacterium]
MKKRVLITGAGLTGLSCAFEFRRRKKDFLIIEKENFCGGLAASFYKSGFTFDFSGHLLHLRWPETSSFIKGMLKGNILKIKRKSAIYFKGKLVPYPFQANLYGLPPQDRSYCVREFLRTLEDSVPSPKDFKNWTLSVFGKGISKYFMLPYNEKLWQHPLEKMSLGWMGSFVPVPDPSEILKGAYFPSSSSLGYNGLFHYPRRGGIGALSSALSSASGPINYGCELLSVKAFEKKASVRGMGEISYGTLVNTSSLKDFTLKIKDAPESVRQAAKKLKSNRIYILNLGLKKKSPPYHWIYFPQKEYPFYRLGFYDNFSPFSATSGHGALYAEIAVKESETLNTDRAYSSCIRALSKLGFIKDERDILQAQWLKVDSAYAFYDFEREKALQEINSWLLSKNIHSIGRYGAWKYSFMEENIKDGFETARKII